MSRDSRTTIAQFEIMVSFFETHRNLLTGKLTNSFKASDRRKEWDKLANHLNCSGYGPAKSKDKWRKAWNDYKGVVKMKATDIEAGRKKTGGGTPLEPLTMWISGIEGVPNQVSGKIFIHHCSYTQQQIHRTQNKQLVHLHKILITYTHFHKKQITHTHFYQILNTHKHFSKIHQNTHTQNTTHLH